MPAQEPLTGFGFGPWQVADSIAASRRCCLV